MKLKNIFIAVLAAGFLTACVAEDMVIGPSSGVPGLDTSLSLMLDISGVLETKAYVGEEGNKYTEATPEELLVSKVAVIVFKKVNGIPTDTVASVYVTPTKTGLGGTKDTLAYQVNGIPCKTGDVRIVAIANSSLTHEQLRNYKTYNELKAAIETNPTATFTPSELVKVGEIDETLKPTGNNIVIPMTQLAARIKLRFKVDQKLTKAGDPYYRAFYDGKEYDEAAIATWTKGGANVPGKVDVDCKHYGTFYADGKTFIVKKAKMLHLYNFDVELVQPYIAQKYEISKLTIQNIETKSEIIIDGINTEKGPLSSKEFVNDADVYTFYTYEKNVNTQNPLNIIAEGVLYETQIDSISSWSGQTHVFWIKKGKGGKIEPDEPGGTTYTIDDGGWAEGGFFLALPVSAVDLKKSAQDQGKIGEEKPTDVSYAGIINPKIAMGDDIDGIIHGHTYDVLANIPINSTKASSDSSWGSMIIKSRLY